MRLSTILEMEAEFIPLDRSKSSAHTIGKQLARAALTKTGAHQARARKLAHTLANKFASDVAATIDDELGMREQPGIDIRA